MGVVVDAVLPFFAIIAAGAVLGRVGVLSGEGLRGINAFVFWLAFPALLITALPRAFEEADAGGAAVFAGAYAVASVLQYALAYGVGRLVLRLPATDAPGHAMAGSMGNTAYLALPLSVAAFGPQAAAYGAFALIVDNILLMPIAVAGLASAARGVSPLQALGPAILAAARNPIVLAAGAGVALGALGWTLPRPAATTLSLLGAAASPAALVALGAMIVNEVRASPKGVAAPALGGVVTKLLLYPALMAGVLLAAGVEGVAFAVGVTFAAAPTALHVFVQTTAYGVYAARATIVVAATTLAAVVTLSGVVVWLSGL